MGIFDGLQGYLRLIAKNILSLNYAPLGADVFTSEEIDKLIKYYKLYLADHSPGKNDRMRAAALLGLAMSYCRRAIHHSSFHRDDINQAIHFAHQAEPYYSKEAFRAAWETLQEILGTAYMIKADGSRSENYQLAIPYLENCLESSQAHRSTDYKVGIHVALMQAYSGSTKARNPKKVKEHAARAVELYPDKQDERWVEFISQMEIVAALGLSRDVIDLGSPDDLNVLLPLLRAADLSGEGATDISRVLQMFSLKARMVEISEPLIEEIMSLPLTEEARLKFSKDVRNFRLVNLFSDNPDLLPPEKLETFKAAVEKLIAEYLVLLNSFETADWRALGEMDAADLFIQKAMFTLDPDEREAILNQARSYFEKGWQWTAQSTQRSIRLMTGGRLYGTLLYFCHHEWAEAVNIYDVVLKALHADYSVSMGTRGKEVTLMGVSAQGVSLTLNQAYALARLGRVEEAVMLLEKWRGRQLNERLKRTDYLLAQVKTEDLAAYQQLSSEIQKLEAMQRDTEQAKYLDAARQLRAVRAELETVVERIRAYVPEFLAEPGLEDLKRVAANKPLAYLLTTGVGSLILLVMATCDTRCLWLDDFTSADAQAILEELSPALGLTEERLTSGNVAMQILPGVLTQLGQKLLTRLVEELQQIGAESVCLIPCGILALFPLHAATMFDGTAVLDHLTVSYAPSAHAVLKAQRKLQRRKVAPNNAIKLVCVADPNRNLRYAVTEADTISSLCRAPDKITLLLQDAATRAALHNALPQATHVHFACHGTFNAAEPLETALLLAHGERLTLREVLDAGEFQRLSDVQLVVLSACQTALIDYDDMPEEALGLPIGFFGAGIPGIVGTLWPVNDLSTSLLMARFYYNHIKLHLPPARALKESQKWLRDVTQDEKELFCMELTESDLPSQARDLHSRSQATCATTAHPFANPYFWSGFVFIGT
jgi:CHAT domain-containing protein